MMRLASFTDEEMMNLLDLSEQLKALSRGDAVTVKYYRKDAYASAEGIVRECSAEEQTLRIFLDAGFRDAFEGIPEADRPTLPANDFYPPATFDHILVRGLPSPLARSVGADIRTSDHRPLRASFPLGEFAR